MSDINQISVIIEREIEKLKALSESSAEPLDRNSAGILNDYLKSLVMARKDEREIAKAEALAQMGDSDLEILAREALVFLEGGKDNE